eukprot:SAG25_NODE_44_length_19254_cov_246.998121_2_plen_58_part_00
MSMGWQDTLEVLQEFDTDGNGTVSRGELSTGLQRMGLGSLTDPELDEVGPHALMKPR